MDCHGVVKGNVVVLEQGTPFPEGTHVKITPLHEMRKGSSAALLEVWGSDVPDDAWEAVEQAIEEIDRADREYERVLRGA